MFSLYQNTSDAMYRQLWDTERGMRDALTGNAPIWFDLKCTCGKDEPIEMMTDYGGAYYWPGRACRYCKVITKQQNPFPIEGWSMVDKGPKWLKDGYPEWSPFAEEG